MSGAVELDLEAELNPQQLAAVTHGDGPQLVLAGAGSGKTRVITYRIAWLVHARGVDPSRIVAVTFTNKAAAEMRQRVESLLGLEPLPTFVGTFHRFCLGLLRAYGPRVGVPAGFMIVDTSDQLALVKKALKEEQLDESAFPPRSVLARISSAKNRLMGPVEFEAAASNYFDRQVALAYRRYQEALRRAEGVDFDDMLRLAVRLLIEHDDVAARVRGRIQHLLVDEFQDTNHCQLRLVLELAGPDGNLTAVGDEDQGIYRWRGADLDNILRFEASFPGAVTRKLERNYRSTRNILTAADAVVRHNVGRRGKRLWTEAGPGEAIELYRARDEQDEARWVVQVLRGLQGEFGYDETAVLVRTNAQTRALEEELLRHQVPYTLVAGVRFYERAEIKDLVAYLRAVRNPRDGVSLARILNQPPRGIGRSTQEQLAERAARDGVPVWDILAHDELAGFPARSATALRAFRDLLTELQASAEELDLPAFLGRLLERTGYAALYEKDEPEAQARLENIGEFLSAAQEFTEREAAEGGEDPLAAFLDHVALVTDIDAWNPDRGVSLMTLHSAKGLEFPVVFVSGLEEGLLPHFNAGDARDDIEEERRLLYVGMTRARRRLFLSHCRRRRIAGRYQDQTESPFLAEIPEEVLVVHESPELFDGARVDGVYSFFGRRPRSRPERPGPAAGAGRVRRGRRVRHPNLGQGVILATEGSGEEMKLTIYFDRAGKKKLVAKYAGLELL